MFYRTLQNLLTRCTLNTTRMYLPANYAFGYLSSIDVTEGVNSIDVIASDSNVDCVNDVRNESNESADMPGHDARLANLPSCGIQIGSMF